MFILLSEHRVFEFLVFDAMERNVEDDIGRSHVTQGRESPIGCEGEKEEEGESDHMGAGNCQTLGSERLSKGARHVHPSFWAEA